MTQVELESIARKMRAKGLHSSWQELLTFSEDVVDSLADAYQALIKSTTLSNKISSNDPSDTEKLIRDKLAKALTLLTSGAQVARWQSEAAAENHAIATQETEDPKVRDSKGKGSHCQ